MDFFKASRSHNTNTTDKKETIEQLQLRKKFLKVSFNIFTPHLQLKKALTKVP